jgi:PAS domain S-box-containing protein
MIGTSIFNLIPEEHREQKHLLLARIGRGETVERTETERIKKDGTILQISLASSPILNRHGDIVGVSEIAHDITERKRAQEALRESEERFRGIFASQENGIFIIDPSDHRIVDANPFICDLVGLPKERIIGKVCHSFVCPAEAGRCPITDLGQTVDNSERVLITADGRKIPIIKTVVRIRIDKKDFLIENINDISERKAAEEMIRAANEQLEERVKQRTAELVTMTRDLEDEVKQRRAAEEVVRSQLEEKTVLLREVHHRVKNNLQIIMSLISLQSRNFADPTLQMALNESQNRIRSMSYVHEKLYNSGDVGRVALEGYVRFLAGNLFTLYRMSPDRIQLVVETHDVAVDINTAIPLGLVLNELISNSIRHAFSPEVVGEIRITADEDADGSLHLVVWDNGRGIPAGFDPENSDTLGLKLAYGLIGQLDGTITSQTNGGQQYTIDIIRKKGERTGPGTYNPVSS